MDLFYESLHPEEENSSVLNRVKGNGIIYLLKAVK